jgi:tetratricopeptide (TPR) repeat protein
VRPLLPGTPGSVTFVTSRRRLAGPAGATRLAVDVFSPDEALSLLTRVAPDLPAGDDPAALQRVADRCAYLPLALDLVGAHMRAKAGWTATDHAEWLDERRRSHRLDGAVDAALNLSYGGLPPDVRRTFRLLGGNPGHDADEYGVAALADVDLVTAREHLTRLVTEHLLRTSVPERYVFHDLVRAFAVDRLREEDSASSRRDATGRLLAYQLHTAALAMDVVIPAEVHMRPRVPAATTPWPELGSADAARDWLESERANLVAGAVHAAADGRAEHALALSTTIYRFLDNGGHFADGVTLHTLAGDAARDAGDRMAEARALLQRGTVHDRVGRYEEAIADTSAAIRLYGRMQARLEQARALGNRAGTSSRMGDLQQTIADNELALALFREVGGQALDEARALANLGASYGYIGRHDEAISYNHQALETCRELGDRDGQMWAHVNLADAYRLAGRLHPAVEHGTSAVALARELRHGYGEPWTMLCLGHPQALLGRHAEATANLEAALVLFESLGDPEGEAETRAVLADLARAANADSP